MDLEKVYRIARKRAWGVCKSRAPGWAEDVTQELVIEYYIDGIYISRTKALDVLRRLVGYTLYKKRCYTTKHIKHTWFIDHRTPFEAVEARLSLRPILWATSLTEVQGEALEGFLRGEHLRVAGQTVRGQRWTAALRKLRKAKNDFVDNRVTN